MKKQHKIFTPVEEIKAKRIKMLIDIIINIVLIALASAGLMWSYCINYYENMDIPHHKGETLWFWGWFTFITTAMICVSSALMVIFSSRAYKRNETELPNFVHVIRNCAIAGTIITFIITQVDTWKDLPTIHISKITDANLIEHIIIPFLAIPSHFILERTTKMKFVQVCYNFILGLTYSAHYLAVGYTHIMPDGTMPKGPTGDGDRYDRYGIFKMLGAKYAWLLIFAMCGALFLFGWLCWLANRKIHVGENKAPKIFGVKKLQAQRTTIKAK